MTGLPWKRGSSGNPGPTFPCGNDFLKSFICLFLTVLGLCGRSGFSLAAASRGYSLVVKPGFLISLTPRVAEHRLHSRRLQWLRHAELSGSAARGFFPDQRWSLCVLHRQADSSPLTLREAPRVHRDCDCLSFSVLARPESHPGVTGLAERTTLDPRQMRLTTVISHLYSQPQGGRSHVPHRATEHLHLGAE